MTNLTLTQIEAKIEVSRRKAEEHKIKEARANRISAEEDYVSNNVCTLIGTLKIPAEEIE